MKLTSHEEYGLRCLIRLGRAGDGSSLTISDIGRAEHISSPYTAKLLRMLRRAGFVKSVRGQAGGYSLARPASQIIVGDVLGILGGRLFEADFCKSHSGQVRVCANSTDCSIRTLWRAVQLALDQVLGKTTLQDLLRTEEDMRKWVNALASLKSAAVTINRMVI
jgi:Rrf2 family transcriptional regulator, iron-sulfur cluster assembly transcription factor